LVCQLIKSLEEVVGPSVILTLGLLARQGMVLLNQIHHGLGEV